jgi:hypothetical protein
MFSSDNFTNAEKVSLSQELAIIGAEDTPLSTLLLTSGKTEQATSTIFSYIEKTLDDTADISAKEGSDDIVDVASARAQLSNIEQIFKKGATVSGSALAMKATQFSEEINDRLLELKMNMEDAFFNSTKDDGSKSPYVRRMSGLIEAADANNSVNVGEMTQAVIKQAMRNLWEKKLVAGNYYAFVNADIKDQIDALYDSQVRYNQPVTSPFGTLVNQIQTNYGLLNVVLSRHVPVDKIVTVNDAYLAVAFLRQPVFEPLAKTGDNVRGQVVAEATLKIASPKAVSVTTVVTPEPTTSTTTHA